MRKILLLLALATSVPGWSQITYENGGSEKITYMQVDESMDTMAPVIDEFRGKVILLDFWATWCRPCIAEFDDYGPIYALQEAEEDFEVIFVSLDKGRTQQWQKMIEKYNLQGYHFQVSYPMHIFLNNEWGVKAIPRYIIVGRDGKIFEPDAPRPSLSKELMRKVNRALQESVQG